MNVHSVFLFFILFIDFHNIYLMLSSVWTSMNRGFKNE